MFKKIVSNTISQIFSKVWSAIIAIFLISLLTNYLTVELYWLYSKIYNYIWIFVFLADLWLYAITIREITNNKDKTEKIKKAYSYYSQIKDYKKIDKDRTAITLISSINLNDENLKYLNSELDSLILSEEQLFYYKTSITCKKNFNLCKKLFSDYFTNRDIKDQEEKENIEVWTWVLIKKEKFEELENIKTALENYENFKIDDVLYKWALISWAFFENLLYPVAIETSKSLLKEKKDYKPLLKIIAKSYYELWNYVDSKVYLIKYNKLVKDDAEASYFLWVIYERLHEYILSTIHFKKAIKLWYENNLDLSRRILFNYYELWEIERMLTVFKTIINEHELEITQDDFSIAIYYNIVNEEMNDAKIFAKKALKRFPESEIFNWYMWWILMDEIDSKPQEIKNTEDNTSMSWSKVEETETIKDEIEKEEPDLYKQAEEYIEKWLEINPKNPMITLVKWKFEMSKWNLKKAFIYFKKTVSLDNNWDFWNIAKEELERIKTNK